MSELTISDDDPPTFPRAVEWGLDQLDAHENSASRISIGMGLAGLGLLLLLFASATPIALEIVNQVSPTGPPNYLIGTTVIQSIILPPVISGAIVVSAIFFWYVPILLRFLLAVLLVVPASLSFIALMAYLEPPVGLSFIKVFFAAMLALFIGAGTVSLTIQMWSPWTLCHLRDQTVAFPKLGTRALFELTAVTAVSFAIIIALSTDPELSSNEFIVALMLFAAFGVLLSMTGIGLFFAFLRKNENQRRVALIAFVLAFTAASLLPSFIAVAEFGWNAIFGDLLLIVLASTYGVLLIGIVAAVHLCWLRLCGWRCACRRRAGQPSSLSS